MKQLRGTATQRAGYQTGGSRRPPTKRDDEEPHVAQPVGGLVGEVVHKEAEDSAEVVLRSGHGDFDGDGRLGVAVAAGGQGRWS